MGNHKKENNVTKKVSRDMNKMMRQVSNPTKMLEEINDIDLVKEMKKMGDNMQDNLNLMQEHLIIVQQNQVNFQEYFEANYKLLQKVEKKIELMGIEIDSIKAELKRDE